MAPRKFCKRKITLEGITVDVPGRDGITQFLTTSGTFTDGDIRLNEHGLQMVSNVQPTNEKDDQTTLQDFETVKVVGRGASAVVQLVCHKWTGQLFAMKVIPLNIEEAIIKQVLDELKIIHSFTCPYIVQFYDAFYHNGSVSILLEYMDSGTLGDLLKKKKTIPEPQLAVICKQVLQGLVLLHKQHIIHRDIKPSNLLLNSKGNVKIADFGVSAVLANTLQQRDTFVGTFTYMAPERIVGSKYGYLSDIWSLGITILECALGHLPYLSLGEVVPDSVYELLQMIVERPPPTAPSDQFSDEFCSFVSACVQKDPESRTPASVLLEHAFIKKYGNLDEASEGTL